MQSSPKKYFFHIERVIETLNILDEETRHQYHSVIENKKFHLQPDATYIISNYSIPDAKSHALEFKTNPRGNVKSVKEVK